MSVCSSLDFYCRDETKYCANNVLSKYGIIPVNKIASTIQGSVYDGKLNKNNELISVVIKRSNKNWVKNGLAKGINIGKYINVHESILVEAQILMYLNTLQMGKGILKMYDFIADEVNYFLITQNGGKSLYDHIKHASKSVIDRNEWSNHVRILFKQMVDIIHFLHNIAHVCHKDISIENFLINNCVIKDGKFISHGNINICDFGLSEFYGKTAPKFKTNKPTGKAFYQAPEIYNERQRVYDGRLLDLWSLGITLFVMEFGFFPKNSDISALPSGNFKNCIKSMLCFYKNRSYITDIMSCPYLS